MNTEITQKLPELIDLVRKIKNKPLKTSILNVINSIVNSHRQDLKNKNVAWLEGLSDDVSKK